MMIYGEKTAKNFDPDARITFPCKQFLPLTAVNVIVRTDLDNVKKGHFSFVITHIPGKISPAFVFSSKTSVERDKWVERCHYLSRMSVDLISLHKSSELLRKKLFSANTLLKMNVGEKLLENLLSGKYKVGSRRYKEVQYHLDGYFEIWEKIMGQKLELHRELLANKRNKAKSCGELSICSQQDLEESTIKQKMLKKVIATMGHVRKDSVSNAGDISKLR